MRKAVQITIACGEMGNQFAALTADGTMWWFNAGTGRWIDLPPIPQPAPEPAWPDARTVCGEVYQVVGVLAERFPDCSLAHVLDNLSAATEGRPVPHATLLPFVAPEPAKVTSAPVTDAMVEAVETYLDRMKVPGGALAFDAGYRAACEAISCDLRAILETRRG